MWHYSSAHLTIPDYAGERGEETGKMISDLCLKGTGLD